MPASSEVSRRGFLRHAAVGTAGVAAPYLVSARALGKEDKLPASERIQVGLIGCGGMGQGEPRRLCGPTRRGRNGRLRRLEDTRPGGGRPVQSECQTVSRLPRDAGPQGRRRGDHRHAAPLALPHGDRRLRGGQGRLPSKAHDVALGRKSWR